MSIGERIISLRNDRNITQSQLAKLMDVSRQAVSKWENDLAAPDTVRLIQLADVLNTDVEYLATGNHTTKKESPKVIPVYHPVERIVEVEVEKVIEKPVIVEKIVEVEKPLEVPSKPKIKRVVRTKYIRNPIEYMIVGAVCFLLGILVGFIL